MCKHGGIEHCVTLDDRIKAQLKEHTFNANIAPKGVQYTLLQLDIDYSLHVPYPLHFFHGIEYVLIEIGNIQQSICVNTICGWLRLIHVIINNVLKKSLFVISCLNNSYINLVERGEKMIEQSEKCQYMEQTTIKSNMYCSIINPRLDSHKKRRGTIKLVRLRDSSQFLFLKERHKKSYKNELS